MSASDVSDDGTLHAGVSNNKLSVYNVCKNQVLFSVKEKHSNVTTKIIKISPSKAAIAWLQSSPSRLSLVHVLSKKVTHIKLSTDFVFDHVLWSPDGQYLALFSNLSLFIDVYQIGEDAASHVASISGALSDTHGWPIAQFSPDGEYFATVNVSNLGHSITLYCIEDSAWDCVQRVFTRGCHGVGGLLWCSDSASLLLWQKGLDLRMELWTLDSRLEHVLTENAAPVGSVCLSRCGRMAAVFSTDGRVRIVDLLTWQLGAMGVLVHCPIIHESFSRSRLKENSDRTGRINICQPVTETLYELDHVSRSKRRRLLQFSAEAQYLATYEPVYPNTLWVWNLTSSTVSDTVVVLTGDINGLLWHREKHVLAASLTDNRVLVWTPQEAVVVYPEDDQHPLTAQTYFATEYELECDDSLTI